MVSPANTFPFVCFVFSSHQIQAALRKFKSLNITKQHLFLLCVSPAWPEKLFLLVILLLFLALEVFMSVVLI